MMKWRKWLCGKLVRMTSRFGTPDPLPEWSTLQRLGKNRFVRSSYFWLLFVPIAAKALDKIGTCHNVNLLGTTFPIHFALPFSWYVFFFAALAGSIGTFLYSAFCPVIIRDFADYPEFERSGRGWLQMRPFLFQAMVDHSSTSSEIDAELCRFMLQMVVRGPSDPNQLESWLSKANGAVAKGEPESPFCIHPEIKNRLTHADLRSENSAPAFWFIRYFAERSQMLARLACTTSYALFGFLMTWVFLQNIISVLKMAFR